jgi:hypothetical protein
MAHTKLRKETNCLNCGAEVDGRYCKYCGQENIEPKQTFWQLTVHFIEDLTHFDGKFFKVLKSLFFNPGFLTREYMIGRRADYINPIRMYLFISAMYFLLLMSVFLPYEEAHKDAKPQSRSNQNVALNIDTTINNEIAFADTSSKIQVTREGRNLKIKDKRKSKGWFNDETVASYDSTQKALAAGKKDGWFAHYFKRKTLQNIESYEKDPELWSHKMWGNFYHSLPYVLFLSLPLIGLLLQLLYIRREQFYYVGHIIFLLHFYCVVFITLSISGLLALCGKWGDTTGTIMETGLFLYLLIAMKRFYQQGWGKTIIKYMIFVFTGFTIVSLLVLLVVVNAALNVA